MDPRLLLACAALLLAAFPPGALADPGGGDAPGSVALAVDVAPGEYEGDLGGSDVADWVRVAHPAGLAVRAVLSIPEGATATLLVARDSGEAFDGVQLGAGRPFDGAVTLDGRGAVRVGALLEDPAAPPVSYRLSLDVVPPADAAVVSLEAESAPRLVTDVASVHDGLLRRIVLDVANLAPDGPPADGHVDVTVTTVSDGVVRWLAFVPLGLAPGASQRHVLEYEGAGQLGDVLVNAWVYSGADRDRSNDAREIAHYVGVGGTGRGYTLTDRVVCAPVACASTGMDYNALVAWAALGASPESSVWAGAIVDPHGSRGFTWACLGPAPHPAACEAAIGLP